MNSFIDDAISPPVQLIIDSRPLSPPRTFNGKGDSFAAVGGSLEFIPEEKVMSIKSLAMGSVDTLMDRKAELSTTSSFASEVKPAIKSDKSKVPVKKNVPPKQRQLESRSNISSQLRSASRASSVKPETSSRTSLASPINNSNKPMMKLPHTLGQLPKYLMKSKAALNNKPPNANEIKKSSHSINKPLSAKETKTASCTISRCSTQSRLLTAPVSVTSIHQSPEVLEKQVTLMNQKLNDSRKKANDLGKSVENLSKKLEETEKSLATKDQDLNAKAARCTSLDTKVLKMQREYKLHIAGSKDNEEKLKALEIQFSALQKETEKHEKKIADKDNMIEKLRNESHRIKKELDKKTKAYDTLNSESIENLKQREASEKCRSSDGKDNQKNLEKKIKDLEIQLKSRIFEIGVLRKGGGSLAENVRKSKKLGCVVTKNFFPLQKHGLEIVKAGSGDDSNQDYLELKKSVNQHKQEMAQISLKFDDMKQRYARNESLLQLRGEYIKTLQDADEVNRARLIMQALENEKLREKLHKNRSFQDAVDEEVQNMHNTISSQKGQLDFLEKKLKEKDEKIKKLAGSKA